MEGRTTVRGLTREQAGERLRIDGPNVIPPPRRPSPVRRLVGGLTHFFALMLWVAAVLALLAGMPQLTIAVVAVIVLNAIFAFVQEARADRAAERLSAMLPARVTVIRDGVRTDIDATEVVEGDAIALESGDRIPADATVTRALALFLDTSMLTGESRPVSVQAADRVYAGTFVVEGEGDCVVDATGVRTRLAEISRLATAAPKPPTPLALELRRVVRLIAIIAVAVGALFFAISAMLGNPLSEGFIFAVGVTVALVPEALLPTVTLTLAWGAEQMAKRKVLVRHLEAVETLGSTTCICTDKTGTLTRNEMTVVRAWTAHGSAASDSLGYAPQGDLTFAGDHAEASVREVARVAAACSDGYVFERDGQWHAHGDPMEAAIDAFARKLGIDTGALRAGVDGRFPFDPRRRRMSAYVHGAVAVKGATDSLLGCCTQSPSPDEIHAVCDAWAAQGLRVLAVAERPAARLPASDAEAERDLAFVGLLGLQDPPRGDVRASLDACRAAGIAVIMVTGDHPATAQAIADQVGLREPAGIVTTGAELPRGDAELAALLGPGGAVVARVTPEDKLRIAQCLRAAGHVVAMTGDGVNDVPALHASNIGISMGESGTDVAREAADLVLLDDHFASIVAGIEQGRATFVNIRRFLTYHLTDNVAELTPFVVWALTGGAFPLALGVLQILALDIGTDTLTAVALGAEPPARHLLNGPPVAGRLLNGTVLRRAFGVLGPTESLVSMAVFVAVLLAFGPITAATPSAIAVASGAAFLTVVLGQMANAWACRSSTRSPWSIGWWGNRLLLPAALAGLAFSVAMLVVPVFAHAMGQQAPPAWAWALAALAMPAVLAMDAFDKWLSRRRRRAGVLASPPPTRRFHASRE